MKRLFVLTLVIALLAGLAAPVWAGFSSMSGGRSFSSGSFSAGRSFSSPARSFSSPSFSSPARSFSSPVKSFSNSTPSHSFFDTTKSNDSVSTPRESSSLPINSLNRSTVQLPARTYIYDSSPSFFQWMIIWSIFNTRNVQPNEEGKYKVAEKWLTEEDIKEKQRNSWVMFAFILAVLGTVVGVFIYIYLQNKKKEDSNGLYL